MASSVHVSPPAALVTSRASPLVGTRRFFDGQTFCTAVNQSAAALDAPKQMSPVRLGAAVGQWSFTAPTELFLSFFPLSFVPA